MQALYDATAGPHWHTCATTFRADPCGCDMGVPWAACGGDGGGVCCRRTPGAAAAGSTHVTEIYLGSSGLAGSLPQSLLGLAHLQWLELACGALGSPRGRKEAHAFEGGARVWRGRGARACVLYCSVFRRIRLNSPGHARIPR